MTESASVITKFVKFSGGTHVNPEKVRLSLAPMTTRIGGAARLLGYSIETLRRLELPDLRLKG